jgi:hypothetical protein
MYKLFLVDLRAPPDGSWVVARTVAAAYLYIQEYGLPLTMSLDHDLGDGIDAPVLLHKLISDDLDGLPGADFSAVVITVHSANPIGRANLLGLVHSYRNRS